jgi:4-deoxy-L-threo-5-hexosulose-uronate ketol-isomerase
MIMKIRYAISPDETKRLNTEQLREKFLVEDLFRDNEVRLVYSHYDRMIIGGVKPLTKTILLPNEEALKADYFLERRELGIINVGGAGIVLADENKFTVNKMDCVYLGKGTKEVTFKSSSPQDPALFYLLSASAHKTYPNCIIKKNETEPLHLGMQATSNKRTIYKYIHLEGIKSCQLVMGLTVLDDCSVWNSIPPHTHTRRTEVYFYFDVKDQQRVIHFMGEIHQTRHILMANYQAVISPPWSTHFGCGTCNYGFIWGMAGENLLYTDMDGALIAELR